MQEQQQAIFLHGLVLLLFFQEMREPEQAFVRKRDICPE